MSSSEGFLKLVYGVKKEARNVRKRFVKRERNESSSLRITRDFVKHIDRPSSVIRKDKKDKLS